MRRVLYLACLAGWAIHAGTLAAQTPSQPRLYLSLFTGYRGGGQLWTLRNQPFIVYDSIGGMIPGEYDTLDIERRITPSLLIGTEGAYFPTQSLGLEAELAFLSMGLESRCAIRQYQPPDATDFDPALCASLTGQSVTSGAVSISVGLVGRVNATGNTTPYAHLDAGLLARSRGTVRMDATYTTGGQEAQLTVLDDPHPRTTDVHVTMGAGVAFSLGPSYQLRFEGQDILARLDRVTGPGDPSGGAPTPVHSGHFYHNFAFVVALDVIFEQRRGRRY